MRTRLAIMVAASSVALSGCAYGVGGYGSPFGGLSVGVSYGSGYGGYGRYGSCYDPYYGGYGNYGLGYGGYGGYDRYGFPVGGYGYGSRYGYGDYCGYGYSPYWGWHNGYYYPGTGRYVYDRYRRARLWDRAMERYWTERLQKAREAAQAQNRTITPQAQWRDFSARQADVRRSQVERGVSRQRVEQPGELSAQRQQAIQERRAIRQAIEERRIRQRESRQSEERVRTVRDDD